MERSKAHQKSVHDEHQLVKYPQSFSICDYFMAVIDSKFLTAWYAWHNLNNCHGPGLTSWSSTDIPSWFCSSNSTEARGEIRNPQRHDENQQLTIVNG